MKKPQQHPQNQTWTERLTLLLLRIGIIHWPRLRRMLALRHWLLFPDRIIRQLTQAIMNRLPLPPDPRR